MLDSKSVTHFKAVAIGIGTTPTNDARTKATKLVPIARKKNFASIQADSDSALFAFFVRAASTKRQFL